MTSQDFSEEGTRWGLSRRTVLKATAVGSIGLGGLTGFSGSAAAAPGDVLGDVSLPSSGPGVGITFTGQHVIVIDGLGGTTMDLYDPVQSGSAPLASTKSIQDGGGNPVTLSAITWDPTRTRLWGANSSGDVYLVDIQDPTDGSQDAIATLEFNANHPQQSDRLVDGLAYDGRSDTIWYSPDVVSRVFEFQPDGTKVGEVTPKKADGSDVVRVSGVAVGADKGGRRTLYIGENQEFTNGNILRVFADDGSHISDFAVSTEFRVEDIVCNPLTYAPDEAILVKDAFEGRYRAFEVEPDTCPLPGLQVPVDIKPTSCPNPLNVKSKGVLPVAILGTADFNVSDVDPSTVTLEGVSPLRWNLEDVATPFEPVVGREAADDCTTAGPDGFVDLTFKFDTQAVVDALGPVNDGDVLVLSLEGELTDGTNFSGEDVVEIKKKGK